MSWGPQQGPQGYPQQPQQPYGRPPQPPKSGIGAGVIVAIVGGLLALLVVVVGVVAYLVFRGDSGAGSSSSSSAAAESVDGDHSDVLKAKVETLVAAVKTGKSKQTEGPLLDLAMTPETAKAWFTATFDPKIADTLYGDWNTLVFPNITDIVQSCRTAISADETEVRVTRFANKADAEACVTAFCKYRDQGNLAKVFSAMTKPQPLYLVSLAKPGSEVGASDEDVFYFAEIHGSFSYVGHLTIL